MALQHARMEPAAQRALLLQIRRPGAETLVQAHGCIKHCVSSAGFTLVELMVTLFIAAILFTVAVPTFTETIASNRLTTQANDIVAAVTSARSEAIVRNQNIALCRIDTATDTTCSTSAGTWENWLITNAAGAVIRRGSIDSGGDMAVTSTLVNDQVVFGSDGLARTNGALVADNLITVCANRTMDNNIRQITLGAGSRISTDRLTGACT